MTLNMTKGKPMGLLVRFALPMVFSGLLQQMYTLCDSFIVGRLLGTVAFTAATSASNLNWFPLSILYGAVGGFSVTLAQSFGSGNREEFRRYFAGTISLALLLAAGLSALGLLWTQEFLILMKTPPQLLDLARSYVQVLWMGFTVTAILNVFSSALLATGDSKTPLVALAISSFLNIFLDVTFISWFSMGIAGAALATMLSQAAAAIWSFRGLKLAGDILPNGRHFRMERRVLIQLLRMGFPQALCTGVTASGELLVQAAVNSYGVVFVTGFTASRRYLNLLNVVGGGLEGSVATFVGQNWGAKKPDRIENGTRCAARMGLVTSAVIGLAVSLTAEFWIRFLVPDAPAEAITIGIQALQVEALFLPTLYWLCEYRAAIRGMGNAMIPMFSGFLELAMRIGCTLALPLWLGSKGLYFTDAAAWVPTMAMLMGSYFWMRRKSLRPLH